MEDRGYLVAHPTLIDPKGHAPAEQQHITHKVRNSGFASLEQENRHFYVFVLRKKDYLYSLVILCLKIGNETEKQTY